MWKKLPTRVRTALTHFITAVLVLLVAWLWWKYSGDTPRVASKQGPVVQAQTPPKVTRKVATHRIPAPKEVTYLDKPSLSETLKMPEMNFSDNVNPIAVTEVAPHPGKTTVVAMMDTNTGEASLLTRQEPQKFLELKKQFTISGRYLFVGRNLLETDLVANPLRVGPVEVEGGVGMEVRRDDSQLGARGWIGFSYRF